MYVRLIVRDECERLVKNQVSKVELVDFVTSSREVTCEKATCGAHDWKMKSCARLSISQLSCKKGQPAKVFVWQKVVFCFTKSLLILYISSLPTNCNECFFREKTLGNVLET